MSEATTQPSRLELRRPGGEPPSAWRDPALWLLLIFVAVVYLHRLGELSIRGEESRWANVAREMLQSGDWIVPRQQGLPYPSRPPLHAALLALLTALTGSNGTFLARLPSALAVVLTTLLIYHYAWHVYGRLGALTAGLAYATMGQTLAAGRVSETDAMFTLLLSAAYLGWYLPYTRGSTSTAWLIGYTCAAFATLAKGIQAPLYFITITWVWLALQRDWRTLVCRGHALGLVTYAAIVGVWLVPFAVRLGTEGLRQVGIGEALLRSQGADLSDVAWHGLAYPFELLAGMLPWSLLLLGTAAVVRGADSASASSRFALLCVAVGFLSLLLVAGSRTRHFMPMLPAAAVLVGAVVAQAAAREPGPTISRVWSIFLSVVAVLAGLSAPVIAALAVIAPRDFPWHQPLPFAAVACAVAVATALLALRARRVNTIRTAVLAVGTFMGIVYTGCLQNHFVNGIVDTEQAVRDLEHRLPAGHRLVSLGPVHHLFAYYYGGPIEQLRRDIDLSELEEPGVYFCFDHDSESALRFPEPWEHIATISTARTKTRTSYTEVIVGRRPPAAIRSAKQ